MESDPPSRTFFRFRRLLPLLPFLGIVSRAAAGTFDEFASSRPTGSAVPETVLGVAIGVLFLLCIVLYAVQTALGALTEIDEEDEEGEKRPASSMVPPPPNAPLLERVCWSGTILCNVVSGILSVLLAMALVPARFAVPAGILAGLAAAAFQLAFFDILVRQIALNHVEAVIRWLAPVARVATLPLRPLVARLLRLEIENLSNATASAFVHERELRLLPHFRGVDNVVEEEAVELIDSVREFFDLTARDIMTPRTELEGVPRTIARDDLFRALRQTRKSRVLVHGRDFDDIHGFLLAKEVLLGDPEDPFAMLRKPVVVRTTTHLPDLLREMRRERSNLALVVDEYGGTAGIATFHDLFEALIGEHISDEEEDDELWIEKRSADEALVSGRVELWEIDEQLGLELDETVARTIGGLLMHHFGRMPQVGEEARIGGAHFRVVEVQDNRIAAVEFRRHRPEHAHAAAQDAAESEHAP